LIGAATHSSGEVRVIPIEFDATPRRPEAAAPALTVPTPAAASPSTARFAKHLPAQTLALSVVDQPPDQRRPERTSSLFGFFVAAPSAQPKARPSFFPARVSVPVLVSTDPLPPDLREAFARAQLAAPLDALVNPCRNDHETAYRAFLRAAVTPASGPERSLALWEHGQLLKERSRGAGPFTESAKSLEDALGATRGTWLIGQMAASSGGQCRAPARSLFRNNKLAYYEHAVELLREALYGQAVTAQSDTVKEAAACLRAAFRERDGARPSCGESLNGMWTTYYAPFLPAALIQSETKRVP
jgi:hypothetical protein